MSAAAVAPNSPPSTLMVHETDPESPTTKSEDCGSGNGNGLRLTQSSNEEGDAEYSRSTISRNNNNVVSASDGDSSSSTSTTMSDGGGHGTSSSRSSSSSSPLDGGPQETKRSAQHIAHDDRGQQHQQPPQPIHMMHHSKPFATRPTPIGSIHNDINGQIHHIESAAVAAPSATAALAAPTAYQPFVLTGDLRRIVAEVAKTGVCSWLPWDHQDPGVIGGRSRVSTVAVASTTEDVKEHRAMGMGSAIGGGGSTCTSGVATPTTSGTFSSTLPPGGLNSLFTPASSAAIAKLSTMANNSSSSNNPSGSSAADGGVGGGGGNPTSGSNNNVSDNAQASSSPNSSATTPPSTTSPTAAAAATGQAAAAPANLAAGSTPNQPTSAVNTNTSPNNASATAASGAAAAATSAAHLSQSSSAAATLPAVAATGATHYPQPFSTHRRSHGAKSNPSRKKHRKNGRHASSAGYRQSPGGNRKRPLVLVRTPSLNSTGTVGSTTGACGSVGSSGRASGSEMDDSTLYECDSEGTTATTNSEMSLDRNRGDLSVRGRKRRGGHSTTAFASLKMGHAMEDAAPLEEESSPPIHYKTLQEAVRVAIGLVLDHYYRRRGGYRLSPAEKLRIATLEAKNKNDGINSNDNNNNSSNGHRDPRYALSPEAIFQQRRERLLLMLISSEPDRDGWMGKPRGEHTKGPPFTIQRIAEVLLHPERCYTQTHKLCNCLEKLLLVTSATNAFGGSTGGNTSQSRREERELAALADEKGRLESEMWQRRVKRRRISFPVAEMSSGMNSGNPDRRSIEKRQGAHMSSNASEKMSGSSLAQGSAHQHHADDDEDDSTREKLVAAARASLRSKFDHVGIDPHSTAAEHRSTTDSRSMTKSPPPPSLANVGLGNHSFVRQHHGEQSGGGGGSGSDHHGVGRLHTPILLAPSLPNVRSSEPHSSHGSRLVHLQHHSPNASAGTHERNRPSPMDLVSYNYGGHAGGIGMGGIRSHLANADSQSYDNEGRSSASNSDVDSEPDDVSFDDSASDRSDGSDSGSLTHYEPFTPARAMALNRIQQEQRMRSRAFTSLSSLQPNDPSYRPPADSEYQSGDSIDSTRAEDSGGSDSSSSDLAD
mmetsp:Transcript_17408/g.49112  ORF Transcript_17408/g.49112 Transcript_17408/m.49112 type:complete len:1108 (-) Transcript_17408:113-3436(-)